MQKCENVGFCKCEKTIVTNTLTVHLSIYFHTNRADDLLGQPCEYTDRVPYWPKGQTAPTKQRVPDNMY